MNGGWSGDPQWSINTIQGWLSFSGLFTDRSTRISLPLIMMIYLVFLIQFIH